MSWCGTSREISGWGLRPAGYLRKLCKSIAWEVGMRVQKGQLDFRLDIGAWRQDLLSQGVVELSVDGAIAPAQAFWRICTGTLPTASS